MHTDTTPCPCSHTPRGIVHVFAGHVNTQHARDGPHLGAQPLFVRVGNERSHAARWLIQRDMAPEWGAWCRIKLGREGVLCHNFSRSSLQPILGGGCLHPVWCDCQLRPCSFAHLGAAVAAADRLFQLIYHGFSCINFSDRSHIYLPSYGPQLGAPDVPTTGAGTVSTFWGLAT